MSTLRIVHSKEVWLTSVFTKMASDRIGDGLGGFVVEATAAATIFAYLAFLYFFRQWDQAVSTPGIVYFINSHRHLRRRWYGLVLSAISETWSAVRSADGLGRGCVIDGGCGNWSVFRESASLPRILGIILSIVGLFLLRKQKPQLVCGSCCSTGRAPSGAVAAVRLKSTAQLAYIFNQPSCWGWLWRFVNSEFAASFFVRQRSSFPPALN